MARIEGSVTYELVGYIAPVGGDDNSKDVEITLRTTLTLGGFVFGTRHLTPFYLVLMHTINPLCLIKSRMGIFL